MNKLLIALALLWATGAHAGAKLTVETGYYKNAGKVPPPTFGLGVYQSLGKGFAINNWNGIGFQPRASDETVRWFNSKTEILKHYGPLYLGLGYAFKHAQKPEVIAPGQELLLQVSEHKVYGKLGLRLW